MSLISFKIYFVLYFFSQWLWINVCGVQEKKCIVMGHRVLWYVDIDWGQSFCYALSESIVPQKHYWYFNIHSLGMIFFKSGYTVSLYAHLNETFSCVRFIHSFLLPTAFALNFVICFTVGSACLQMLWITKIDIVMVRSDSLTVQNCHLILYSGEQCVYRISLGVDIGTLYSSPEDICAIKVPKLSL